jgi:2',3'-cyclic-nucleotide 2'-phosphodiesterase/3'-nucleotidase
VLGTAGWTLAGAGAGVGAATGRAPGAEPENGEEPPSGDGSGRTTLKLVHDTHVHGRLGEPDANENVENYFGLMHHLTAQCEHAMRLGNGDDLGPSALSTEFQGEHIVESFEAGDLGHDTFGNHDFDFGPEVLRTRVEETEGFRWVSANVVDRRTGEVFAREQGAKRFDIVEMGEVPVGITGILTERARNVTNLGENAEVRNPTEAMSEVMPAMRAAGAKVIVVLSHVANDVAVEVARNVDNLDVIVGDDAAEVLGDTVVNDTVLAFVGDGYDHLGELTLDVRGKTVHGYDFTLHEVCTAVDELGIESDAAVEEVANTYRERLDREVIGESTVELNCVTEELRTRETNMGNFVADAIGEDVDSDVVIQNGGGIRTDTLYPPGDVTDLLIRQVLPFGNSTVELEVSGETLLAALENGVSEVETLEGRFPQVSGMEFVWDPGAPAGDRIVGVTIDGDPLDPAATYALGTNNFVAGGGDGYGMLTDAPRVQEGENLASVVIDRIRRLTPISPEVQGRITRRTADTDATLSPEALAGD